MHTGRRSGRARSRILYWFRTPPGVRVGRAALDEDAIRHIEDHNPDVEFDWTRILKGQGAPEAVPVAAAPARGQRQRGQQGRPPRGPDTRIHPTSAAEPIPSLPAAVAAPVVAGRAGTPDLIAAPTDVWPAASEAGADVSASPVVPDGPLTAAGARLGSEGLSRLRARHAEVLARISEKITDAATQVELRAEAERLNPDTWVTDADVTAGLEKYETVFESLRAVVGRQRRRRRRGRSNDDARSQSPRASPGDSVPENDDPDPDGSSEPDSGGGHV